MNTYSQPIQGSGLGLRRGTILDSLLEQKLESVDFLEVAPENWVGIGGKDAFQLAQLMELYPLICHGLTLDIGGQLPLSLDFLQSLKTFFQQNHVSIYSEHLCFTADDGQLYDLMPLPFTEEAVKHVARRIRQVQDYLEMPLAIENISYYLSPGGEMTELEFINAVLDTADCKLLLDVNNIYVNSVNHNYDPEVFLKGLPMERVQYIHVAGHHQRSEDLIIDTHGSDVTDPVWSLLAQAYSQLGPCPTLLERDFNIPELSNIERELNVIAQLQSQTGKEIRYDSLHK